MIYRVKRIGYGWGEVYHNNTCILKNPDVLWFNGVDEESIAFKSEIGQGNARQREKILGERGMFV